MLVGKGSYLVLVILPVGMHLQSTAVPSRNGMLCVMFMYVRVCVCVCVCVTANYLQRLEEAE